MTELIIFDMDGTMLDTEPLSLKAMIHAAEVMGYEMPDEFFNELIGRNEAHARRIIRERYGEGFDYDRASELHNEYIMDYVDKNGMPIKPGLFELLDLLEKKGKRKCVATSTAKQNATEKLAIAGIAHRFEVIVGGDEVAESKPNPEIFLKAAAFCKVEPKNCLVLEDSAAGTRGAYAAGIPVIIIPDIAPLDDEVKKLGVAVCKNLFEVARII